MSPNQVMHAHKDNFAILNSEIVNVLVEQALPLNKLTLLTGNEKFEFQTHTLSDNVVALFSKTLGEKLTVRRGSPSHS